MCTTGISSVEARASRRDAGARAVTGVVQPGRGPCSAMVARDEMLDEIRVLYGLVQAVSDHQLDRQRFVPFSLGMVGHRRPTATLGPAGSTPVQVCSIWEHGKRQ